MPLRRLLLLLTLLGVAGCSATAAGPAERLGPQDSASSPGGFHGVVLDVPYRLPTAGFTDTAGRPTTFAQHVGASVTLVFFGYTHCPDVCSTVLATVAAALRRAPAQVRRRTQVIFVTTDPDRDSPRVIRSYLDRFDRSYTGLTAALPTIRATAGSLGVAIAGRSAPSGGGYDVAHGAQVVGFGPDRQGRLVWPPGISVADLRADLSRLAGPR